MTCLSCVHWYVTAQENGLFIIRLLWFRLSAHLSVRYALSRSTPLSSLVCQLKHPTRPGTLLIKSTTEQHYGLGIRKGNLSDNVIQGQLHVR